ncbi:protein VAPYRIN-like [Manihot esculenta]|uniref:protein VAPYRIN-like n=1 Tax=Manihot esculenta TaxID=3983 RepID=UPI001CC7E069|nr:protein VAPYRIN-like [Manihot esculenta]
MSFLFINHHNVQAISPFLTSPSPLMERPLIVVSDSEVRLDFMLNFKCRANVRLRSLSATTPIAFKTTNPSPILFPSFSLRPFPPNSSDLTNPDSLNSWFSSLPLWSTQDFKLKVAFVGPFLLRHAVSSGDVNSVKNIIKRQRSILSELSPREAESLLRVATELADPEGMVNLLLEAGLKIDARAKADDVGFHQMDAKWQSKGWCELHVAIAFDRTDEVLDSLDSFGPLDLRDKEGRTPLHLAAGRGNIKCARVLVESGADKDAKSKDGWTALYRAAANGDHKMVEMLIEMGSDPTIADNHGRSAFDVARDKGHLNIVTN